MTDKIASIFGGQARTILTIHRLFLSFRIELFQLVAPFLFLMLNHLAFPGAEHASMTLVEATGHRDHF